MLILRKPKNIMAPQLNKTGVFEGQEINGVLAEIWLHN